MGTTVWIDAQTRERLRELQDAFGTPSVNATIQRLLDQPAMDARALFAKHSQAIRRLLARHGVRSLTAFGSRARGDARPDSDLDVAIELAPKAGPLAVLALEADLEDLLSLKVNVTELPNPRVAAALRREGIRFAA